MRHSSYKQLMCLHEILLLLLWGTSSSWAALQEAWHLRFLQLNRKWQFDSMAEALSLEVRVRLGTAETCCAVQLQPV